MIKRFLIVLTALALLVVGCGAPPSAPAPKPAPKQQESPQVKGIPKEITQVVFGETGFFLPFTITLPVEDDPNTPQKLQARTQPGTLSLCPIFMSNYDSFRMKMAGVGGFLVKHGFIVRRDFTIVWGMQYYKKTYTMMSYTDKIVPYVYKGNYRYGTGETFDIRIASRVLKSAIRKPYGEEKGKSYLVIFTYTIKPEFPYYDELRSISPYVDVDQPARIGFVHVPVPGTYEGRALVVYDSYKEKWKLNRIDLDEETAAEER